MLELPLRLALLFRWRRDASAIATKSSNYGSHNPLYFCVGRCASLERPLAILNTYVVTVVPIASMCRCYLSVPLHVYTYMYLGV